MSDLLEHIDSDQDDCSICSQQEVDAALHATHIGCRRWTQRTDNKSDTEGGDEVRFWQEALGLLAVLWAGQAFGSWAQMGRYRDVMRSVVREWPDGCVGVSAARSTFGKGVIAIVVASPDAIVRQVFLMEGRSVFAKFREFSEARGGSLATLATDALGVGHKGRRKALAGAVAQIKAALERRPAAQIAAEAAATAA